MALAAKRSISKKPASEIELSGEEVEKWILETLKRQHWSPWEFSWYVFEVECSRVCTHQLVRHRIASYTQLSQRHNIHLLKKLFDGILNRVSIKCSKNDYMCFALAIEEFERKLVKSRENKVLENELFSIVGEAFQIPYSIKGDREVYREYIKYLLSTVKFYLVMLSRGVPYEDARYILPQAIMSKIIVAMNARELATSFLPLRMCARPQKETREVAWKLWHKLVKIHPRLFTYVGPRCILLENTLRDKPIPVRDLLNEDTKIELLLHRCPEGLPKIDSVK